MTGVSQPQNPHGPPVAQPAPVAVARTPPPSPHPGATCGTPFACCRCRYRCPFLCRGVACGWACGASRLGWWPDAARAPPVPATRARASCGRAFGAVRGPGRWRWGWSCALASWALLGAVRVTATWTSHPPPAYRPGCAGATACRAHAGCAAPAAAVSGGRRRCCYCATPCRSPRSPRRCRRRPQTCGRGGGVSSPVASACRAATNGRVQGGGGCLCLSSPAAHGADGPFRRRRCPSYCCHGDAFHLACRGGLLSARSCCGWVGAPGHDTSSADAQPACPTCASRRCGRCG